MNLVHNAKISEKLKIHFLCWDKSGSYIKICTREHFPSFMVSFMLLPILILRGKIALEEKSCRKTGREHKDSGKKSLQLQRMISARKRRRGHLLVKWFLEIIKCIHPEITHIIHRLQAHMALLKTRKTENSTKIISSFKRIFPECQPSLSVPPQPPSTLSMPSNKCYCRVCLLVTAVRLVEKHC